MCSPARRRIEHWTHAERSGLVAGRSMAGVSTALTLLNYVWSDIFDTRIDYAGYHANYEEHAVKGMLGEGGSCIFYLRRHAVEGTARLTLRRASGPSTTA
jgi:NADPH-dependent 2,4-dienoyl-CoA reductase/sulfur reductase-like enzyme